MKKAIPLILAAVFTLFVTMAVSAQAITDIEQAAFFKQRLDPSLVEMEKANFAALYGEGTLNIGVDTRWNTRCRCRADERWGQFGMYFSFTEEDFQTTVYASKMTGRFSGTFFAGMYEVEDRAATYAGVSLLYHHRYGAFGVKIMDLFDVPLKNTSAAAFFEYEQMTPEFVIQNTILEINETKLIGQAAASYQDLNGWGYSWSGEVSLPLASFGYGRNRELEYFGYVKAKFKKAAAFASLGGRGFSVGFNSSF